MNTHNVVMMALVLAVAMPGMAADDPKPATASATTQEARRNTVVGFSQIGAESAWRTAQTESFRAEAAKRGITLILSDAQQRQASQIKAVRNFIAQGVDAIILSPVMKSGWEPVLREAKAAGIPVIVVERPIDVSDPSLYVTVVGPDFVEEGRIAGRWLAKALKGKGNIAELRGTTGSAPAIDRGKGFREELDKHPDLRIIMSETGDFTRSKGKEVMEAFLRSGKKIDALYAHNDDMALGAIQAIEEAGQKPGTDIIVVSIDGVKAAFEAMVAGKLNATVECTPELGPPAFDAVEAIVAGKLVPKEIHPEERLFEQSQAKDLIDSRKY